MEFLENPNVARVLNAVGIAGALLAATVITYGCDGEPNPPINPNNSTIIDTSEPSDKELARQEMIDNYLGLNPQIEVEGDEGRKGLVIIGAALEEGCGLSENPGEGLPDAVVDMIESMPEPANGFRLYQSALREAQTDLTDPFGRRICTS